MNLQHLYYFLDLAKTKSFSLSADKLYISQPALSKAIKKLEQELDILLFNRVGNETHLTNEGLIFYEYVSKGLESLDKGIAHINSITDSKKDLIRIGSIYSCLSYCVPLSIKFFLNRYPDVKFQCYQGTSSELVELIREQKIDFCLASECEIPYDDKFINKVKLYDNDVVLVVPSNSPLAKEASVTIDDIYEYPFIGYTDDNLNFKNVKDSLKKQGYDFPKNIRSSYNTEDAVISAVKHGLGIGFISKTKSDLCERVKTIELKSCTLGLPVYFVWRSDVFPSALVNAYKDYVLQAHHRKTFY